MGLGVVVACHNVAEFLPACLESLLAQELLPTQVILVDDGSTDDTPEVCRRYADGRKGWQVVHGPGSGPGGARELGVAHVTEEFLAFVDGDDVVPPEGFRVLVSSLQRTGSDMASGDVRRYDGVRLLPSGPHRNAIAASKRRTTIRRTPSLMYDTTAWNKVFRTRFWRDAGVHFQADVFYEDIPAMVAAHVAAQSVDVLRTPVYWWRRRVDADASITQRRGDLENLRDRMQSILEVDRLLAGDPLKAVHDRKVLTFDVPLYLPYYASAAPVYQALFLQQVGQFVAGACADVMAELEPRDRLRYFLIAQGRHEQLLEFLEFEKDPYALRRNVCADGVTYADLPFRGLPGFPDDLYAWGVAQPVASMVESAEWTAEGLAVGGYCYLKNIDSGDAQQRKLRVRVLGAGQPFQVPVKWHDRTDLTAAEWSVDATYDNVGLSFTVPFAQFPESGTLRIEVDVAAPGGRRRVPLGGTFDGSAQLPRRAILPDGRIAIVRWRGDALTISVHQPQPMVSGAEILGGGRIRVRFDRVEGGARVVGSRREDLETVEVEQSDAVELDISGLRRLESTETTEVDVLLVRGGTAAPALVGPGMTEVLATVDGVEYLVRAGVTGGLLVSTRPPRPRLLTWRAVRKGLRLTGDRVSGMAVLGLEHRNGLRSEYPVSVDGDSWAVTLPADDADACDGISHLASGRWSLLTEDDRPVHVDRAARELIDAPGWFALNKVAIGVRARRTATAYLQIDPSGVIDPPGLHGRQRIIEDYYPTRRARRTRRIILFENWKGKQYSDSLRAIDEELSRRKDRRKRVWVVRDRGVRMPHGVHTVLRFSREYYDLLARARWIVSNDSIDPSFVKREDQTYLQTWHGTPLKKVGQDIERVNFARKGYLETFALEVVKWDYLVSPNPYSSQILSRAFGIEGGLLETGYPRNDIFYRPERHVRAELTRRRLGLRPDQKVILYAPTWRDDRYDDRGRYIFDIKLNVDALRERFGDTHVLLLRGHHLLASRAGIPMAGGFVVNVSTYPDIADLYLIADVLITDYSSAMFDFANTGRPMVFYTWDLDDYRDRVRGFYFDLTEDPPGPVCRTSAEVAQALDDLAGVRQQFAQPYARFRERFCAWEDGNAAARVIDAALR
jgi:CDP-glycerol glycerophosphotransferase